MSKLKKALNKVRLLWSEDPTTIYMSPEESATFNVLLGSLHVGTLVFKDNLWFFSYSEDFRSQKEILPLSNFPDKEKTYRSKDLWPFFASRIPSKMQRQEKELEERSLTELLQKFGQKTISNPYVLNPA